MADIDSISYIRDQYLGGSKTNGTVERTHSPTTRSHSNLSTTSSTSSHGNRLTHQNSLPSASDSEDPESRAARIAKYKEQRRKELAQKYGLGTSMIPAAAENDLASRKYRYTRQSSLSSLKSDGEESDYSTRSAADERTDRYRRYSREAAKRLGSERDTSGTKGRHSPSASRYRSLTEPIQLSDASTGKDNRTRRERAESDATENK